MKSGPGVLPSFTLWRAAVNFLCEKMSEGLVLWLSKRQTLLDKQFKMICGQQPRISNFRLPEMEEHQLKRDSDETLS